MGRLIGLFIFISFNAYALTESVVQDLGNGNCWVSHKDEQLKVASFSAGVSKSLEGEDLALPISEVLNQTGQDFEDLKVKPEVFIHCGAYGANVVFNISSKRGRLCIWSDLKDGFLEWGTLSADKSGPCEGNVAGSFMVKAVDNQGAQSLKGLLEKESSPEFSIERLSVHGRYLTVVLKFQSTQDELKEALLARLKDVPEFLDIIPNQKLHAAGEYLKINP